MRPHQRMAALDHAEQQLVDEAVLRAPQRREVEPHAGEEGLGIDVAGVRRVERHRPAQLGRLQNFERRIELVGMDVHGLIRGLHAARFLIRS